MSEHAAPPAEAGESAPTRPVSEGPRWGAFAVTAVTILLLVVTPMVVSALLPPRTEGMVGVYERVLLQSEDEDRPVIGGFIAPQGWLVLDDGEEGDEERPAQRSFITEDGGALVTVSIHSKVESVERLLRADAPIGAGLAPIRRLDFAPLLAVELLEYDLAAGNGAIQRVVACETLGGSSCLLFEVDIDADRAGADALLPDVAAMVQSVEVQP